MVLEIYGYLPPIVPPPAPKPIRKSSQVSQNARKTCENTQKHTVFTPKGDNVWDQMWKKSENVWF